MSRQKQTTQEKYVPSIRDIKVSLFSEYPWIKLLSKRGKPYDHIIEGLLKIGEYWNSEDYDNGTFTMKWMSDQLNETSAHINKWLRAIYYDLFDLNLNEPELFALEGDLLCNFLFSDYSENRSCSFSYGIQALPHVGDTLSFYFIKAALGCDHFHINDIYHDRDCGKTTIAIDCKAGSYNKYRELMLDKARFLDDIGFMTEYEARPYLDEMLKSYARKGYIPSVEAIKREREERYKRWMKLRKK